MASGWHRGSCEGKSSLVASMSIASSQSVDGGFRIHMTTKWDVSQLTELNALDEKGHVLIHAVSQKNPPG